MRLVVTKSFFIVALVLASGNAAFGAGITREISKSDVISWSDLSWNDRFRIGVRIVLAPKLLYRIDRLEVYRDGIWVEYCLTNISITRKYVTPSYLTIPISNMLMWDSKSRQWKIPHFKGSVQFRNPDEFISIEPFATVRFRSRVSPLTSEPLVLTKPALEKKHFCRKNSPTASWHGL
jgi:hypothetical protein